MDFVEGVDHMSRPRTVQNPVHINLDIPRTMYDKISNLKDAKNKNPSMSKKIRFLINKSLKIIAAVE